MSRFDDDIALDFTDVSLLPPVTRRRFLQVFGGGIAILVLGTGLSPACASGAGQTTDFSAYLLVGEDGRVRLLTGKVELGQGTMTALPMMLADELDVALEAVDIVMGDTDLCPWDRGTFGSLTIRQFGPVLLRAAAQARQVLVELAAERLGVPAAGLVTRDGAVHEEGGEGRSVSYADLATGEWIARRLRSEASLKAPATYRVMGVPRKRADAIPKVTGAATFAGDLRVEGMLYARVLRPPAHGAVRKSLDTVAARALPGVVVADTGDLVAVLHEDPEAADAALASIEVEWEVPESALDPETIHAHLLEKVDQYEVVDEGGSVVKGERKATEVVEADYRDGYVAHAAIETHTALAYFEGERLVIHASTQTPFRLQSQAAEAVGLPESQVRVITPFVGGGFGGKSFSLQALEAARLSQLKGRPVQVRWSREREFFEDTFRPASITKVRAGLDGKGNIAFWHYRVYAAGARGARQFYAIPHHRTLSYGAGWSGGSDLHPFRVGAWRAPANNSNTFARESHVELLARAAGRDPLEFRLAHLEDPRMRGVLEALGEAFGWEGWSGGEGRGRGIALGIDADTYVGLAAEVTVDRGTGHVQVDRVVVAQDMGLCVNPAGAVLQAEGCVMMGLGYALSEELRFRGGDVLDANFDTYRLPRFSWTPEIEVVILPRQDQPPTGGGEPAIIAVGAVVANAVHDAVGARVYRMPLTPERVLAALEEKP